MGLFKLHAQRIGQRYEVSTFQARKIEERIRNIRRKCNFLPLGKALLELVMKNLDTTVTISNVMQETS